VENRVSFGLTIPQRGLFFGIGSWPEMIALAHEADRVELFDSVWVGDSVMAKTRPDSLLLLGALSAATSRVKLGVACMASFSIRDSIIFALQWATLDLISNGRMLLAVCTGIVAGGASALEGAVWGIKDAARGNRMAEHIEICRRLWNEERVTFNGKYHSFTDVTIQPRPIQHPSRSGLPPTHHREMPKIRFGAWCGRRMAGCQRTHFPAYSSPTGESSRPISKKPAKTPLLTRRLPITMLTSIRTAMRRWGKVSGSSMNTMARCSRRPWSKDGRLPCGTASCPQPPPCECFASCAPHEWFGLHAEGFEPPSPRTCSSTCPARTL
jgi:hypothetical protein